MNIEDTENLKNLFLFEDIDKNHASTFEILKIIFKVPFSGF